MLDQLFATGNSPPMKLWKPLADLIPQVLLACDLTAVITMATSAATIPQRTTDLAAWIAQLLEQLRGLAPTPRHMIEKKVQSDPGCGPKGNES